MSIHKKAIILSVHSFVDNDVKVGTQYIAEGLVKYGWEVDYVSIFSSLFDFYGTQRHRRLRRVWLKRQHKNGIQITPGITEYAFRAPFPAHKSFLRYDWQTKLFKLLVPSWLCKKKYDICIHDVTANIMYLEMIASDFTILRLNDLPEGFRHSLSGQIIKRISKNISSKRYEEIWSAHEPLNTYVTDLNPANRVFTIRNGVDDKCMAIHPDVKRNPKTVVFLGNIEQWIDLELIDDTAFLLNDWHFDIIGPLSRPWTVKSSNVRWLPPVTRPNVMNILAQYQVGLIPFREISGRLAFVEKPLKFFEYIAAGLGVASTDVGALKDGMGDWAIYGNTPQSFARAIEKAADNIKERSNAERFDLVTRHSWSNVMDTINSRLEKIIPPVT